MKYTIVEFDGDSLVVVNAIAQALADKNIKAKVSSTSEVIPLSDGNYPLWFNETVAPDSKLIVRRVRV